MLLAAEVNRLTQRRKTIFCAKLNHQTARRCIFCDSRNVALVLACLATGLAGSHTVHIPGWSIS
jgi:hypothetical protein